MIYSQDFSKTSAFNDFVKSKRKIFFDNIQSEKYMKFFMFIGWVNDNSRIMTLEYWANKKIYRYNYIENNFVDIFSIITTLFNYGHEMCFSSSIVIDKHDYQE